MSEASAPLPDLIEQEIATRGPIPFARFMELCLFHPRHGYYTRGLGGGGGRDYLTSSGIHRAYGALVARQAGEMWRRTERPDPFLFVEFGPGEGYFAADFLQEAARTQEFAAALRYLLVETSAALAARQKARLAGHASIPVEWIAEEDLERRAGFSGCLFANEVLDAFPVHRVVGTPDGPREVHVTARDGVLEETLLPLSGAAVARFLEEEAVRPQEGQEVDLNLAAPCWISWAVRLLRRGYLLVVDYGKEAPDLYHPARRRGTLLAYHRHGANEEFLLRPGAQDLTAHLDWTALRKAAERAGGRYLGRTTQARFLLALGALDFFPRAGEGSAGGPAPALLRRIADREALKDLVLPERMGDRFSVLSVGVGDVPRDLAGLSEPWARSREEAPAAPPGRAARRAAGAAGEER
ncbi:MAG: SAM-dependent methyltransferase [Acidobacteria bacterium]|nr:SAM-dependent methyltransferase [Acidobacteriota bacterium]